MSFHCNASLKVSYAAFKTQSVSNHKATPLMRVKAAPVHPRVHYIHAPECHKTQSMYTITDVYTINVTQSIELTDNNLIRVNKVRNDCNYKDKHNNNIHYL